MCGIAGWIGYLENDGYRVAEDLAVSLRHRGPDSKDAKHFDCATLVHTRLSIIDLSDLGAQPMSNEDESVWVAFNGEIYNHVPLRTRLQNQGHHFQGRSDTEILPHLYEELDDDFVSHLRGMFAIALYDKNKKRLLLVRDRFGIKPLFYAPTENGLVFASELNAIKRVDGVDLRPDRQAICDYAALHYIPAPQTAYMGIRNLEPGQILEAYWNGNKVMYSARTYHGWSIEPDGALSYQDALERAESLIQTAVQSQLESDVPLGALLSGGIDSSLVSVSAKKALREELRTFNVSFDDDLYDETWAAVAVADHIRSQHQTLKMTDVSSPWSYTVGLLHQAGQPYADTSILALNLIAQEMRRHVTVALSGDGGDEAYGGYGSHLRLPYLGLLGRLPRLLRRIGFWGASSLARLPAAIGMVPHQIPYRLSDLSDSEDIVDLIRSLMSWMRDEEQRRICRDRDFLPSRRHYLPRWKSNLDDMSTLEKAAAILTEAQVRLRMANDYLFKVDTASMRHSLEIRVPMLDEDLFALGLSLPYHLKVSQNEGKRVLRGVAMRQLPVLVAKKPKQGFAVPVDHWVNNDFRHRFRDALLGPNSVLPEFFNPDVYSPIIDAFSLEERHPLISRAGLYQRAIMFMSLQVHFGDIDG